MKEWSVLLGMSSAAKQAHQTLHYVEYAQMLDPMTQRAHLALLLSPGLLLPSQLVLGGSQVGGH